MSKRSTASMIGVSIMLGTQAVLVYLLWLLVKQNPNLMTAKFVTSISWIEPILVVLSIITIYWMFKFSSEMKPEWATGLSAYLSLVLIFSLFIWVDYLEEQEFITSVRKGQTLSIWNDPQYLPPFQGLILCITIYITYWVFVWRIYIGKGNLRELYFYLGGFMLFTLLQIVYSERVSGTIISYLIGWGKFFAWVATRLFYEIVNRLLHHLTNQEY